MIIATKTGYINKIVHAIPASMYLNASKSVYDDSEKNSPRISNTKPSGSEILKLALGDLEEASKEIEVIKEMVG